VRTNRQNKARRPRVFQALIKQYEEKDRLATKSSVELKDLSEQCDTYERQNGKLQQDLRLALEKLEEMSGEAERFAVEAQDSQKQLADCEQKYEEFQIQTHENIKQ
jgi:predicted  nucleic acid-binding Zn-ribbon protein